MRRKSSLPQDPKSVSVALMPDTRDEMSLDVEDVVNGSVDREEALGRADRFEALHLALSSSHWLVRILCPVVCTQTLIVSPGGSNQLQRRAVRSEFVGNNDGRREALPLQALPEQLQRGRLVSPPLDQDIEYFAFAVDRPPHIHSAPCDRDHHFIEMPSIMRHRPSAPEVSRDRRPKFQYPSSDGLVADLEPALCQQALNIAIA